MFFKDPKVIVVAPSVASHFLITVTPGWQINTMTVKGGIGIHMDQTKPGSVREKIYKTVILNI